MRKIKGYKVTELFNVFLALFVTFVSIISKDYDVAIWTFLLAFSSYNYMQKSKLYRDNKSLQLKFDKFLDKAEVEEIKEFLLDLDSWSEVEKNG